MKQRTQNIIVFLSGMILGPGFGYIIKSRWRTAMAIESLFLLSVAIFSFGRLIELRIGFIYLLLILFIIHIWSAVAAVKLNAPFDKTGRIIAGLILVSLFGGILDLMITESVKKSHYLIASNEAKTGFQNLTNGDIILIKVKDKNEIPADLSYIYARNKATGNITVLQKETYIKHDDFYELLGVPLYIVFSPDIDRIGKRLNP